jgi:hypothetical protein
MKGTKHRQALVPEETFYHVHEAFQWSPCKSIWRTLCKLTTPKSTVQEILHKCLNQMNTSWSWYRPWANDHTNHKDFTLETLHHIEYLHKVLSSNGAIFHISSQINRHSIRRTYWDPYFKLCTNVLYDEQLLRKLIWASCKVSVMTNMNQHVT